MLTTSTAQTQTSTYWTGLTRKEAGIWKYPPLTDSCEASPLMKALFGHFKMREHGLPGSYFECVSGISFTSQCLKHFLLQSIWFWRVLDKWGSSELGESVNATVSSLPDASLSNLCTGNEREGFTQNVWAIFEGTFLTLKSQNLSVEKVSHHGSISYFSITTSYTKTGKMWACILGTNCVLTVPKIHVLSSVPASSLYH